MNNVSIMSVLKCSCNLVSDVCYKVEVVVVSIGWQLEILRPSLGARLVSRWRGVNQFFRIRRFLGCDFGVRL